MGALFALVGMVGFLAVCLVIVEGGSELAKRLVMRWHDRKLFKKNRREMRLYY